jgi:hypothetical protein
MTDRELTDAIQFAYDQIRVYEGEVLHYQKDRAREIFAQANLDSFRNILKQLKRLQMILKEINGE